MNIESPRFIIKLYVRLKDSPYEWKEVGGELELGSMASPNPEIIEVRVKTIDKKRIEANRF